MADKNKKDKGRKSKHKDSTGRAEKQRSSALAPAAALLELPAADADLAATQPFLPASTEKTKPAKSAKKKVKGAASAPPPRITGARRTTSTDAAILDAALACIAEKGVGNLTTRRIAEVASVNEVTIFRRFGSKQALVQAIFAREAQRIGNAAGRYTGDVEADLVRIAGALSEAAQSGRTSAFMLLGALGQDAALRAVASELVQALAGLADFLKRYMDQGILRQEPPTRALGALLGPLLLDAAVAGSGPASALELRALVDAFLQGRLNARVP